MRATRMTRLQVRDIAVTLDARRILDGVALSGRPGEVIGLVGPNGAGKSTLLRAIAGVLQGASGSVAIEGQDLASLDPRGRARLLAMLPQALPDTLGFSGLDVVLMGTYAQTGALGRETAHERRVAADAMATTGTRPFARRRVTTLSGGERQRVFLARALAQEPSVLLLDEPTANLDIAHQLRVMELVRALADGGVTVIAAIHDLGLAARTCDRVVVLDRGRVVADGPPVEVLTGPVIRRVFGVRAITHDDVLTGQLALFFHDAHPNEGDVRRGRAHVVCGGGTGARLMYELDRRGVEVTAGPLGDGDTDAAAARMLGIDHVPVASFAPIDDPALAEHERHAAAADVVILCGMPIGWNNLRSLEALRHVRRLVSLESTPFRERDHTDGTATLLFERLPIQVRCARLEDAVAAVLAAVPEPGAGSSVGGPPAAAAPGVLHAVA